MLRSIAIISLSVMLAGCDLPNDGPSSTSSSETDGVSTTSSPTTGEGTEGMSSTSSPTTGDEPPVTECHDVLGGFGFEPPEELVGQVCKTCMGEDCGCLWGVELGNQCVLDCESDPCPAALQCLHLQWDGQDAWGCWPHASEGSGSGSGSGSKPEPDPGCAPIMDLQGTVIGQSCPAAACLMGIEPLTGICLQPCELGCPEGQACRQVVLDQDLTGICWPAEA